jgi:hypothetical protein
MALTDILIFLGFIISIIVFRKIVSDNSFSSSLSLDEKVRISRLMLLICSSLCGAMLLVVMAASVYAYHNVEAKKISDGLQFWIIFIQFWLFLAPLVALIRPG